MDYLPKTQPNKHKWTYNFVFDYGNDGTENYSFTTDGGYKYASEVAFNNALFNGTRKVLYAGKYKTVEVTNAQLS